MRDTPRVAFLVIMDAFLIALLVMAMSGCAAMPASYPDRIGDFINNVASTADTVSTAPRVP